MKNLTLILIIIFSVVWTSSQGHSAGVTFQPIGPQDSCICSLAIDPSNPSIMYAGTISGFFPNITCVGSGVYKSTDGGESWKLMNVGLPENSITHMIAIDPYTPNTLYVGTFTKVVDGEGIFKSTDGGENWSSINNGLINREIHSEPLIDPITPSTLYIGTEDGIFKSTNGGDSWILVTADQGLKEINPLAIDPANPSTIYAADYYGKWCIGGDDACCEEGSCEWGISEGGLFKSTDGGRNWFPINNGLPDITTPESSIGSMALDPTNSQIVYAASDGGGVFKSINGGGGWFPVNSGLTNLSVYELVIDPSNHFVLYVGTWGDGVFRSGNGGASWTPVNTGLTNLVVGTAFFHPLDPSVLYAGTLGSGVFRGIITETVPIYSILPLLLRTLDNKSQGVTLKKLSE